MNYHYNRAVPLGTSLIETVVRALKLGRGVSVSNARGLANKI